MVKSKQKMPTKTKQKKRIHLQLSVYIRFLYREAGWRICQIAKCYPQFPRRTISWHANKDIEEEVFDKRKNNPGRPQKLTERNKRIILRSIPNSREEAQCFSAKTALRVTGLADHVSPRTARRVMNDDGYYYLKGRHKGVLTPKDRMCRTVFASKVIRLLSINFWREGVSFYFDGVSFAHKSNPLLDATAPPTMMWRRRSEGLKYTCKGKKEGSGGRVAHFFVAISYGKGVILCEQYLESLSGEVFKEFVKTHFPATFERSCNPKKKLFLQDGDPSQNSKKAKTAFEEVGCTVFPIPPRSPDINPIENVFNILRENLKQDVREKQITKETFEEFSERVRVTILNFPPTVIDDTIDTMMKRMALIKKGKGYRTKY